MSMSDKDIRLMQCHETFVRIERIFDILKVCPEDKLKQLVSGIDIDFADIRQQIMSSVDLPEIE